MDHQALAKELSARSGLASSICGALVTELFAVAKEALLNGQKITLSGFGSFYMDGGVARFTPEAPLDGKNFDPAASGFSKVTETQVIRPGSARDKALSTRRKKEPAPAAPAAPAASRTTPKKKEVDPNRPLQEGTQLSSFAESILGLDSGEMERGLGLDGTQKPTSLGQGRRLTFPVQISRQAKDHSSRFWKPTNGEERRSFKDLALKNFFVTLGSVVRDRTTHEPMIVFDVSDHPTPKGERYKIQLLKVAWEQSPSESQRKTKGSGEKEHALRYEEVEFDPDLHEVMMVIDEAMGPRVHSFDIGSFQTNDRRDRAEVCLAQEYETFRADA